MAIAAPINLNRLLGLDEGLNELDPSFLEMLGGSTAAARGGKPDLDVALNNEYFKKTGKRLAPGQLPDPVPLDPETVQAGKTTLQKGLDLLPSVSMPSFGGGAEAPPTESPYISKRTRQDTLGAPGSAAEPMAPIQRAIPGVEALPPSSPLAPTATSPVPGDEPSFLYSALQKHASFIRDVSEGAGAILSGAGAFAFGTATTASQILNDTLARISRGESPIGRVGAPDYTPSGGPFAGGPESPTYYRDIFKHMDKTIADISYEPKSDIAKNMVKGVSKVTGLVKDVSELAGKGATYLGFNEDQAKVLSFAAELYLFYKLDRGVRAAAPELRAKIADFKNKAARGSDAEMAAAAEDLANRAARNPNLDGAMNEARGKFRDEGDMAAGVGPQGPEPQGPPGGGGAYFDPADLSAYQDSLNRTTAEFRRNNPDASIRDLRDVLDNVPKPQPRTRPQPEQAARPTAPTEAPAPTPTAETIIPPGEMAVRPTRTEVPTEAPVATPQVAVPTPTSAVKSQVTTEPTLPAAPVSDPLAEARAVASPPTPRATTVDDVISGRAEPPVPTEAAAVTPPAATPAPAVSEQSVAAAVPESRQGYFGWEGTHTAESAMARAQELGILNTIRTELSRGTTLDDVAAIARQNATGRIQRGEISAIVEAIKNNPEAILAPLREMLNTGKLAELKSLAREAADGGHLITGLTRLGFPREEVRGIADQLSKVRAAPTPIEPLVSVTESVGVPGARQLYEAANAPGVTDIQYRAILAELKGLVREGLRPNQSAKGRLAELGFSPAEIPLVEKQIKGVRAAKPTPAVQTAAAEATLETAPPGTEVEIPAPAEPVVDTSPAIEKPKRKRRIVKAPESPVTDTPMVTEITASAEAATSPAPVSSGDARYYRPANMDDLGATARVGKMDGEPLESAEPQRFPVQLRFPASQLRSEGFGSAKQGAKPDAIFVDTSGMNTTTKLADIEAQVSRGRMSEEIAVALRANLQRQADLTGLPLTEAHTFTGRQLMNEATRIAAETGIDLYVKKGKNYELVPKDVVKMDARINFGDDLKPIPVSKEAAGDYVASKTSDIGPETVRMIREAIELGIDISADLTPELLPHYTEMLARERAGIDTSERRSPEDVTIDAETIKDELNDLRGAKGPRLRGVRGRTRDILADEGGFIDISAISDAAKMAAQRLQADARKLGKNLREFLFGARPEDVAVFENYLERINNPVPPDSTNPTNMRFDPTNVIPGDRIVKQRVISKQLGLNAPPLWQSEVTALQSAKDIKPGGSIISLKTPYWQHRKANTEFIYYAYRTSQKNVDAALNDLHEDMQELSRGFSTKSLENIGANGYQRQGPDGQRILTYNKMTPTPLSPAEKRLQATIDGIYADTWNRINEERVATGREPLPAVDHYQTFARTQSLLNHLNMGSNLIHDSAADIMAKYMKYKSSNFPYTQLRKGAVYSAEMNALKILDTYMQSALKEIHLGPFLGKLHELIEQKLPDPATGEETWLLKDEKPGLYVELRRWNDYLATGSNVDIPEIARYWLNVSNRNLGFAMLSFGLRSAAVQLSTLRNTNQALGTIPTIKGAVSHLMDIVSGGKKWDFALENSEVLSSRKFVDAYNSVASAIIGRSPRDFVRAISRGQIGELQAVVGGAGLKLLEIGDMQAAVMSWNAAYTQATTKMGYSHKDAVRFSDDLVVRTQGSTMPGDLAGIQRNAAGKALTQFQTFAISDWNFLTNEVFSKQQGKISNTKMIVNILKYAMATQLLNELYRMLHIQPPGMELVRDWYKKGSSTWQNLARGASNFIEPIPLLSSTRYGRGVGGPLVETIRDLSRGLRDDPMAPNPLEPAAMLVGAPGTREASKYLRGRKRGENVTDSLLGWYDQEGGRQRQRPERRERSGGGRGR